MSLLILTLFAAEPVTVYTNAMIWTGDGQRPDADTLAVRDGKIVFVGAAKDAPDGAKIDLGGKRVVPGFHDSHVHFLAGGRSLTQVDLKMCENEAAFGKLLKEFDAKLAPGRWIVGGNWDHDRTFEGTPPTAKLIDKYVKDRPVFINRYDGHMAVANSAAMAIAGITKDTKDIAGGVIFRDGDGPTGLLKDNAMGLVEKHVPIPDETEIRDAVQAALQACAAAGITSVTDMDGNTPRTSMECHHILSNLADKQSVRIDRHLPIADWKSYTFAPSIDTNRMTTLGVKGFMDGSLGSSTARMSNAYVNDERNRGVFVTETAVMERLVSSADSSGFIVAVHAIGDEANHEILRIFSRLTAVKRFRIEHAQHLRAEDIPMFKKHNVIASMQPYHVIDDGRWAEKRIGAKLCETSYAYRSLLDAGATLAFGSDWPVAPLSVMQGIDAAVNRRTLDGKHPEGWFPKQRITVAEAVRAYTEGSAIAGMHERDRGKIAPGYVADFVVLSRDIFDPTERDNIVKTEVVKTIMNGDVVFTR